MRVEGFEVEGSKVGDRNKVLGCIVVGFAVHGPRVGNWPGCAVGHSVDGYEDGPTVGGGIGALESLVDGCACLISLGI